jgi:hypothetical protein
MLLLVGLILLGITAVHATSPPQITAPQTSPTAVLIGGTQRIWHPLTLSFNGPQAHETDSNPNPFLDYRLQVTFTGPAGQIYHVPGFFAGDGQGGGSGNVWQVIFAPDATGIWHYTASFRSGPDVAVSLEANAGTPTGFDGISGSLGINGRHCNDPDFLQWGRLEYVGSHYLKFADGPYWLKGGVDSPENFLAYRGFDNTIDHGGLIPDFLHEYAPHVTHWQSGDPYFASRDTGYDSQAIIGALNYLASKQVNSLYFLTMNLGGDGQDVYPFIGASGSHDDNTHYDISKLHQWTQVLQHAQNKGIALQMVLAETEPENMDWLDNGTLGVQRKLFFREMVARFGHLLAIKWNLSEEGRFTITDLRAFADYLQALDWQNHPIAVHTHLDMPGSFDYSYEDMLGDPRFSATSFQYSTAALESLVQSWRIASANAGRPWVLDMDENFAGLTSGNEDALRRQILYPVYFSGGNIEWYLGYHNLPLGGDLNLEDFSTRKQMWDYMWYARRFMEDHLPFWEMVPADGLLVGEHEGNGAGQVFAKLGQVYAVFVPLAYATGSLDLTGQPGLYEMRWYNPRVGEFQGSLRQVAGGGWVSLGPPPAESGEDWVMLVRRVESAAHFGGGSTHYLPYVTVQCSP